MRHGFSVSGPQVLLPLQSHEYRLEEHPEINQFIFVFLHLFAFVVRVRATPEKKATEDINMLVFDHFARLQHLDEFLLLH